MGVVWLHDWMVLQVLWSDIGGQAEIKQKLRESVEWPLKHPEVRAYYTITICLVLKPHYYLATSPDPGQHSGLASFPVCKKKRENGLLPPLLHTTSDQKLVV